MTLLRLTCIGAAVLLAACTPLTRWDTPPFADIARLETVRLLPLTFTTHHGFAPDRERIAGVLGQTLADELARRGYRLVETAGEGELAVTITSIWDERLYVDDDPPMVALAPEVRLHARIQLTRRGDGAVLLAGETLGSGPVDHPWPVMPFGPYTEPQRELARRIAAQFPPR